MAQHSNQSLPCLPLLFPQCPAHIGNDEHFMGHSILAKRSMVDGPASVLSWKGHGRHLWIGSVQKPVEVQFFRGESQQPGSDSSHKLFAGAVHNAQFLLLIKSKD